MANRGKTGQIHFGIGMLVRLLLQEMKLLFPYQVKITKWRIGLHLDGEFVYYA
ncbi:MAG: hypothetical protein HDR01_09350 [Lachnospiraceae bacterium]|nr:hypothetical protein [Lachnospiraceae bacterium]